MIEIEKQREQNARASKIRDYGKALEKQLIVKEERKKIDEIEKE